MLTTLNACGYWSLADREGLGSVHGEVGASHGDLTHDRRVTG